jgi:hypothetical protein
VLVSDLKRMVSRVTYCLQIHTAESASAKEKHENISQNCLEYYIKMNDTVNSLQPAALVKLLRCFEKHLMQNIVFDDY